MCGSRNGTGRRGGRAWVLLLCAAGMTAGADPAPEGDTMIAATLAEQLAVTDPGLRPGYAQERPRLLFGAADREALKAKAERLPELWAEVIRKADTATPDTVLPAADIEAGRRYWHVERIQSAALAYWITGN